MSQGTIITSSIIYDDTAATNDPLKAIFNWQQTWNIASLSNINTLNVSMPFGAYTQLMIPNADTPVSWIQILTNLPLDVLTTSATAGFGSLPSPPSPWDPNHANGTWVAPLTAGGLTKDGLYFVRGAFTGLAIGVPGSVNADVVIFMGL